METALKHFISRNLKFLKCWEVCDLVSVFFIFEIWNLDSETKMKLGNHNFQIYNFQIEDVKWKTQNS